MEQFGLLLLMKCSSSRYEMYICGIALTNKKNHEHYDTNLAMFGRYFLKEMENIFEQNFILFQCAVVTYQSVRGEGTIQSHLISKDGMIQML